MGNFIINHQKNQYGELKPQLFIGYQLAGIPEPLSNSLDIFEIPADSALNYPNVYGELTPQLFVEHQLAGIPEPLSDSLDIFEMPVDTALSYPNSYPVYGNNQVFVVCKSVQPTIVPTPLFF